MPAIKDTARIATKWSLVAGRSADAYQEGVENPRSDWKQATLASNNNWEQATQRAITQKSFRAGVDRSSTDAWQAGAINKGVSRYSAGVALGQANYERGFAPYAAIIRGTNLPDRKPKGDPANIQRVSLMAAALHNGKLRISGAAK